MDRQQISLQIINNKLETMTWSRQDKENLETVIHDFQIRDELITCQILRIKANLGEQDGSEDILVNVATNLTADLISSIVFVTFNQFYKKKRIIIKSQHSEMQINNNDTLEIIKYKVSMWIRNLQNPITKITIRRD